ncbi:hypothetical protein RRG08_000878 [Elysia crispata]|uniref:Cytochrome P450 n=1 Tax=Elysia crispata TaxID=231223 RepID=A0AAE0YEG5_9GAST|nr:hypothetical protein RRG08_000878 [Elysia crispata]
MQPSTKEGGNLPDIIRAGSFHEFLTQLHARYGPISGFWFGQVYTVSIASPELFKQHTHASERPPILYRLFEPTFGSASILYTNGEEFRIRKRQYDRAFGHTRLSSYFHMFQKATDRLVENWSKKEPGDYIPLCEDTFVFAVRAALFTILGEYFEDDGLMIKFKTAYETY